MPRASARAASLKRKSPATRIECRALSFVTLQKMKAAASAVAQLSRIFEVLKSNQADLIDAH